MRHIHFGIKAVAYLTGLDFSIPAISTVPTTYIRNNQYRLRELNIQVNTLITEIVSIDFVYLLDKLIFGKVRVLLHQVIFPIIIV